MPWPSHRDSHAGGSACRENPPAQAEAGALGVVRHIEKPRVGWRESCPAALTAGHSRDHRAGPSFLPASQFGFLGVRAACVHWGALLEQILWGMKAAAGLGRLRQRIVTHVPPGPQLTSWEHQHWGALAACHPALWRRAQVLQGGCPWRGGVTSDRQCLSRDSVVSLQAGNTRGVWEGEDGPAGRPALHTTASLPPAGNLSEINPFRPHHRPAESETKGTGLATLSNKLPRQP